MIAAAGMRSSALGAHTGGHMFGNKLFLAMAVYPEFAVEPADDRYLIAATLVGDDGRPRLEARIRVGMVAERRFFELALRLQEALRHWELAIEAACAPPVRTAPDVAAMREVADHAAPVTHAGTRLKAHAEMIAADWNRAATARAKSKRAKPV